MGLQPLSQLGLVDVTDVRARESDLQGRSPSTSDAVPSPPARERPPRSRRRTTNTPRAGSAPTLSVPAAPSRTETETAPVVPLGDEPTTFVQFMVPGELQARLADMSHALALEHRKLQHQKTILGALVWRYVDPDDVASLERLAGLLDGFLDTELADSAPESKVAAHLPYSLKYKLDGAVLKLRRTRRAASAKAIMSALVVRYVDPLHPEALVELLQEYRTELTPSRLPVAAADAAPAATSAPAV